ncbi:MAG: hypothetical protein ACO3EH_00460 [Ilumatobacteraceae bacterium]
MTLKEYIQSLPAERVQRASVDLDEAAKIEQEHAAVPGAVLDDPADAEAQTQAEVSQNSFDMTSEDDAKQFIRGMELSHPMLANKLRRDPAAWQEMLDLDASYMKRLKAEGGIKLTGDDANDEDFFKWAYGRGMMESDTSFSSLAGGLAKGLWTMVKGAGKLAVLTAKSNVDPRATVKLAATAVDAAQSAVAEYQQLGAGFAALTAGDNPQVKMAAMYELAKYAAKEEKNHNAWRKAISNSFAEIQVDKDSAEFLAEGFDISNLFGFGAGKLATQGLKRVGAGGAAKFLERTAPGTEIFRKVMSKVPVVGVPYERAILVGQSDVLSTEARAAAQELANAQATLASARQTLVSNPPGSSKDALLTEVAKAEKLVAEKQGAFDAAQGQLDSVRGQISNALDLEGRGLLNRTAAGTLNATGAVIEGTGNLMTRTRRGLSELLSGEADNEVADAALGHATGGLSNRGNLLSRVGNDMQVVGRTMAENGSTIPYFRRLRQAQDASKLTRAAAALIDNTNVAWAADKGMDLAQAAAAGAPMSGGFGYVASGGDLLAAAESAGAGAGFGIGGGAYGQWRSYTDPRYRYDELLANRRQFRDMLSTREVNGDSQIKIFDQLQAGEQLALASYAQGKPDVAFRFINDPSPGESGYYDRYNNVVVVNTGSKTPIEDTFRHEIAHYIERHGLEAQVREMYLGDAEKGVIGQYTEIDKLGNPVFVESTDSEGKKTYTYKVNAEGERLKKEYETAIQKRNPTFVMSDQYFSSEVFAEQYADYVFRGGLRRDLSRNTFDNIVDSLAAKPMLKGFMGSIGLLFDRNDNVVGTNVFTGLKSNEEVRKLISKFTSDVGKGRKIEITGEAEDHVFNETELRDPNIATKWLQGGGTMRFGPDGKPVYNANGTPQFLTEKEAEAIQADFANTLIAEIERHVASNPDDADLLQRREITDINGKKSVVYTGRRIPIPVIDALDAQKRFNPHQIAHLRAMAASVEKHGLGAMIAHFYHAASRKLGGKAYKTVAGRWRRDGVVGFQITKDGNVVINSVSWEQLAENAKKAARTKQAREVYATSGVPIDAAITADVKQYLTNLIAGKPGAEVIGEERRNFVNNLLGIRMASNADVNPLFDTTASPKTILTNLRLDRMNRVAPLDSVEYAWGPQQYRQAKNNMRPEGRTAQTDTPVQFLPELRKRDLGTNSEFAAPPSDEEAIDALYENKRAKFGAARDLEPGTPVGLRIDIPAFKRNGVYVVTVHEHASGKSVGEVIGYDTIATVDQPKFMSNKVGAQKIRDGEANKFPIATVEGKFNPSREIPADIDSWTPVGYNPVVHSYFYDKVTDLPVVGGLRAISVGNTVFVKVPVYGELKDYNYRPEVGSEETMTPEFKRWFGDSKVVDEGGQPKVVYHGTPKEFTVFDSSKASYSGWNGFGNWFSDSQPYSKKFSGSFDDQGRRKDGRVIEAYLSMEEPAEYDGEKGFEQLMQDFETYTGVATNKATAADATAFRDYLKKVGFDGVIVRNFTGDLGLSDGKPVDLYVAFDSNQVKETTNQRPTQDPDIQYRPSTVRPRAVEKVAAELGLTEVSQGAKDFGYFMRDMNAKGITPRDVVKAYLITTSSINRRAVPTEKIAANWDGLEHDEAELRPEDAFAKLLGTPEGQRFLNAAVEGRFDEEAANAMLEKFKPFGLYNTQREYMRNAAENLSKVADAIVDAVKNMPTEDYAEFVRENFKGISFGKVGFMSGMMGRGDLPTVDVRERKLWYGDRDVSVDKRILLQVRDRLQKLDIPLTEDLKDYYQTIIHHAVWDRIEGTDTSHADIKQAMLQFRPDPAQPQSEVPMYTKAEKVKAPSVNLQDLLGKRIFPIEGDLTMVGTFRGIDSSVIVPVPAFGGPGFAAAPANVDKDIIWANDKPGKQTQFRNLAKNADYAVIMAQDQDAHTSNTTTVTAFLNTLDAYLKDGRISEKNLAKADSKIRKEAKKMGVDVPSLTDPSFIPTIREATFPVRKRIVDIMESVTFSDLGFPPAKRIIDDLRQPEYHGVGTGDLLLLVRVDPNAAPVKLGENGTAPHPDYKWGIAGQLVGKFDSPIPYRLLFKDYLDARRQSPDDEGPRTDFRSVTLKKPIITVTQGIIDSAVNLAKVGAVSKKQMEAALSAATGSWQTTDRAVKDGGVGVAEFVHALRLNKSAPSLTPYTEDTVKKKVKSGEMKVYKLQNAEIYFALVNDGDKKVISSVVNNEPGARGVAAPAVLAKAIQEGATHLDCFAVTSKDHPEGFLPELYSMYGFEVESKVDFSREFFDADWKAVGENPDIKFADLLHLWQSEGWNPSTPKPQVTFMRLRDELTTNDARQQYNRRLLEQNPDTMADRGRATRRGVRNDAQPNSAGAGEGRAGGNNPGADQRVAPDRGGVSSPFPRRLDDFRSIVRELSKLSDEDARLRGLDVEQLRQLRAILQ